MTSFPAPLGAAGFPSSAEAREEFRRHCSRLRGGFDPFFGEAVIDALASRLSTSPPLPSVFVEGQLANEYLRLGEESRALDHLARARSRVAALPAEARDPVRVPMLEQAILWTEAVAHLRMAEKLNCSAARPGAGCRWPIERRSAHSIPDHARRAAALFLDFHRRNPRTLQARWLLNFAAMAAGDYPDGVPPELRIAPQALAPAARFERWEEIAPRLGLDVFDLAGGAILEDFDGDELLDVVTSSWSLCEPMKVFRNRGDGSFSEVTERWGLDGQLGGINLVHADYDNDGAPDILVLRGGWLGDAGRIRNSLLRNDLRGDAGRFVDVTREAGIADPAYPTQTAAWADYDGDGWLDLYVGNEASGSDADPLSLAGLPGNPYPSQLFRNRGDGSFEEVTARAGVEDLRYTKGVAWGDYDDDGDPDLYVSNLGPNRLYRNEGDGTFTDVAPEVGVTGPETGSFATWFFDWDNDGDLDIFVADYTGPVEKVSAAYLGLPVSGGNPVLYRNEGGRFTDASAAAGLDRPLLPMGANYGDLDNDGWLDVYLGTGTPNFEAVMPSVMYRNREGRTFEDVTFAGGFGHVQKGHGIAFGDLDNDGDQDLLAQMGGAFPADAFFNSLYENPGSENRWIVLRLDGRRSNRLGMGARIALRVREGERQRTIHALAGTGGSFGGSSLQQEIGLGAADRIEALSIRWPGSGTVQHFRGVEPDRFYRAVEGAPELERLRVERLRLDDASPARRSTRHESH